MLIYIDTAFPYEFETKELCLRYVIIRCHNIKHSLRFIQKDTEQLCVRCPVSGDYLEIFGENYEIEWLHKQLNIRGWYRTT